MTDERSLLERQIADVDVRPSTLDQFHGQRKRRQRKRRIATTVLGAVLVAAVVAGVVRTGSDSDRTITVDVPEPTSTTVPVDAPPAVERIVAAINAGDADGFIDQFASDGWFNTRGYFQEGELYGFAFGDGSRLYARETPLVEAWFAINRAWGFEADLRSCSSASVVAEDLDQSVGCEVAVRWPKLSLEIVEVWGFELLGDEVTRWGSTPDPEDLRSFDLDPAERTMPLGYADIEAWEEWLQSTHPEDASVWLNPRNSEESIVEAIGDPDLAARVAPLLTPAQHSWVIDGHEFTPLGLVPYAPAFADEIQASIQEFVADR